MEFNRVENRWSYSERTHGEGVFYSPGTRFLVLFWFFLFYICCAQRIIAPCYTAQRVWCRSEMESSLYGMTHRWEVAQTCFKYHFHFHLLLQLKKNNRLTGQYYHLWKKKVTFKHDNLSKDTNKRIFGWLRAAWFYSVMHFCSSKHFILTKFSNIDVQNRVEGISLSISWSV